MHAGHHIHKTGLSPVLRCISSTEDGDAITMQREGGSCMKAVNFTAHFDQISVRIGPFDSLKDHSRQQMVNFLCSLFIASILHDPITSSSLISWPNSTNTCGPELLLSSSVSSIASNFQSFVTLKVH